MCEPSMLLMIMLQELISDIGNNKEIHQTGMSQEHQATGIPGCLGAWVHLAMKEILLVS